MDMVKVQEQVEALTNTVGSIVPMIGVIGGLVRLIAGAVKPNSAQQAQEFEQAIAAFDNQRAALGAAINEFNAKYPPTGGPLGGPVPDLGRQDQASTNISSASGKDTTGSGR